MTTRIPAVLLASSLLASAGCGSWNFRQVLDNRHPWKSANDTNFYKSFDFKFDKKDAYGNYSETGTLTVVVGDANTSLELTGKFILTNERHTTTPSATVEVTYDITDEVKTRFREAAKQFKVGAKPGDEILTVPDELPNRQTFFACGPTLSFRDREGGPQLNLVGR
jgi:hypothetical protein